MKKLKVIDLLFLVIYFLMFMGAFNKIFTYISLFLTVILSVIIGINSFKEKNTKLCANIILLLCLQNFCLGTGAHLGGNVDQSLKFVTQIPFVVIFIVWCILQLFIFKKKTKISNEKVFFVLLLVCIGISFYIDRGSTASILMNIRNMVVFFMTYEISFYLIDTREEFNNLINRFNRIQLFMLICGIILLFGGYKLYSAIGIDEVYIAKQDAINTFGLNQRFYTYLLSTRILRMGSLYYEPVNLAYLFSCGLIVNFFYKAKNCIHNRTFYIFVSAVGLLLTFGKGGWLVAASILVFSIISIFISRIKYNYLTSIIIMLFCIFAFCIYAYDNISISANPHFWGVTRTFDVVKTRPYGFGLGTGGNMAYALNENYIATYGEDSAWLSSGGESAIMSFMYQLGIQGVFCLVLCMIFLTSYIKPFSIFDKIIKCLPIVLFGVAILQDNTFTPQCITIFMFIIGAYSSIQKKEGMVDSK